MTSKASKPTTSKTKTSQTSKPKTSKTKIWKNLWPRKLRPRNLWPRNLTGNLWPRNWDLTFEVLRLVFEVLALEVSDQLQTPLLRCKRRLKGNFLKHFHFSFVVVPTGSSDDDFCKMELFRNITWMRTPKGKTIKRHCPYGFSGTCILLLSSPFFVTFDLIQIQFRMYLICDGRGPYSPRRFENATVKLLP